MSALDDEFITRLFQPQPWVADAACRGLDTALFFPQRGQTADQAKAVCAVCPVSAECSAAADTNGETSGIWGGMSIKERRRIRRGDHPALKPGPQPGARRNPINHGTPGGYAAHKRRDVPVCDDCRHAFNQAKRAARAANRKPPKPIKHGTYAGYLTHKRRGIDPCDDCLAANAEYHRQWHANRKQNGTAA